VQRPGWVQTTANPPTVVVTRVGQSFGDLDFGNQRPGVDATGDCDGNLAVSINEIITGVNIALGLQDVALCAAFDRNVNGGVTIDELLRAVGYALNGVPTPLPTPTASATAVPTVTSRPTDIPSASPTAPVLLTPTATSTVSRTPSPSPTPPPTPSATRTRTATPTATASPGSAPEITEVTCNGFTGCLLALDEPFTVAFSFEDADGDAAAWEMIAERDDGEIFEIGVGAYAMPFAFGTTRVPFDDGFTCTTGPCIATDWVFTVIVTDLAGNASVPASVQISVLGSGEG